MGVLKNGVCKALEAEADAILKRSMEGITAHSAKSDILTPWKEQARKGREVFTPTGVADSASRQGVFHRAYNPARPEMNSREGHARTRQRGQAGDPAFTALQEFYEDQVGYEG